MAKVCFVPGSGTLAAYLSGEIDHHAAQSIRREIDAQVDDRLPELLTLDFSGVTFMDSSGVGLILGRGRHISALGGRLTVQNPPPAVRRMLEERGFQNIYTTTASCTISSSLVTLALIAAALGRSRRGSTVRPNAMLSNTVMWRNSA